MHGCVYGGGGHVYLLFDRVSRLYKLGATAMLRTRLKAIAAGTCNELVLVWHVATNDHSRLEAAWKTRWKGSNVVGDWFRLSDEQVAHFKLFGRIRFNEARASAYVPEDDPLKPPSGRGAPRKHPPLCVGRAIIPRGR
jgi:hypothetical protein